MLNQLIQFIINRYKMPTKTSSRREYSTGKIAEFWCSISNVGFIFVALLFADIPLFLAGTFSLFSHTIPSQLIHDLDILGVVLIGIKVAVCLPLLILNPWSLLVVLPFGALALGINIIDALFTNKYYHKVGPSIHVAWHLTAAFANLVLNAAVLLSVFGLLGISISVPVVVPVLAVAVPVAAIVAFAVTTFMMLLAAKWSSSFQRYSACEAGAEYLPPPSSGLDNAKSPFHVYGNVFQPPEPAPTHQPVDQSTSLNLRFSNI